MMTVRVNDVNNNCSIIEPAKEKKIRANDF